MEPCMLVEIIYLCLSDDILSSFCHCSIQLYGQRVTSASEELGMNTLVLQRGLEGANVALDNHSLADLSVWEPRTFKVHVNNCQHLSILFIRLSSKCFVSDLFQALGNFAWNNYAARGFGDIKNLGNPPDGVILRGLKK